jgi:asparagine synthase (glutamine-hydrolysing)
MCGLAGIIYPGSDMSLDCLRSMMNAIRHRGKDDEGVWQGEGVLLGHVRLSIIDTSKTGQQPISNENGTIWVVLNGEIYNYKELRADLISKGHVFRGSSDTEVLPHLYEEYGEDFVSHLRGMFAIALWDDNRKKLLLIRDRAGKKPLFYAKIPGGGLAFCSEIKGLFRVPGVDIGVRNQGVYDFLTYGVIPGCQTVYHGIHRVPPASCLTFRLGEKFEITQYWNLSLLPKLEISREEADKEVERLLNESISLRLRSDVPVGCFLSGGIDSGLITAIASKQLSSPLKTYCVGFDDEQFDERSFASQVAKRFGTNHKEFVLKSKDLKDDLQKIISHYDEPYAAQSAIPSYAVAKLASSDIKVALNGDGADEIFAGYRHFVAGRFIERFNLAQTGRSSDFFRHFNSFMPLPKNGRTRYQLLHRFIDVLGQKGAARYLALTNDRLREHEKVKLYGTKYKQNSFQSSLRFIENLEGQSQGLGMMDSLLLKDFKQMLPDDHLVKMDMATMAHSLEVRSPFLDHKIIEFVAKLPESYRLNSFETKPILRKLAAKLLPSNIATGKKRGFEIPLLRWMEHDLNDLLMDTVLSDNSYSMNNFDRNAVRSLLSGKGLDKKRWANIVWELLCLEIWWLNYKDMSKNRFN